MKRAKAILMTVAVLLVLHVQPATAASDFSLVDGALEQTSNEYALLEAFLRSMPIASSFDEAQNKYVLSGEMTLQGTAEYERNRATGSDTAAGAVTGEFDPISGSYAGNFTYTQDFSGQFNDGNGDYAATVFALHGEFSGSSKPGDRNVILAFSGTRVDVDGGLTQSSFVNRPGFDGGLDSPRGSSHASAQEVSAGVAGASDSARARGSS